MRLSKPLRPRRIQPKKLERPPAVVQHLGMLAGLVRLLGDLGHDRASIRQALVATHRAGLRELAKRSPTTAIQVADAARPIVAGALADLS